MKPRTVFLIAILLSSSPVSTILGQDNDTSSPQDNFWVGAYLASYNHFVPPSGNWGNLPTGQIDWDAFTHLYYFAFNVESDGSLSEVAPYQNMSPDRIRSAVSAAHSAGKPVLFTVGGWGNHDAFVQAIAPPVREDFISNLIQMMENWGFDGIDLDLEPIEDNDLSHYADFIEELHRQLQTVTTRGGNRPLLTIATDSQPAFFARLHDRFDQINLMTYDFSGAWDGWVSWHNAAVYSEGHTFPESDVSLPSVDKTVNEFIQAGVPAFKLSIGIDFYGYVWSGGAGTPTGGVTEPGQAWTTPPTVTENVPYHEIMLKYFQEDSYHWDDELKAAWLGIDAPGNENDKFISFDDERTIQSKVEYASDNGLGGVFIWELSGGYRQNMPVGQRDILLRIVKEAGRDVSRLPAGDAGQQSGGQN